MASLLPVLVIESATAACSAALLGRDGELLAERHEIVGRGHAERLVPMIAELLDGGRPGSILVDCGPGSFTGVRVGLAAAHGLAIGWRVPLAGYSSLALLAAAAGDEPVAAALTGGHGELFVQSFAGEPLAAVDVLRSLAPEAAAALIPAPLVVGSGAQALVEARGTGKWLDRLPRAAEARHLPAALRSLPARPIYGRAPDARPMIEGSVGLPRGTGETRGADAE
jgi:tRNA threonylcarbamoyladenosine biosynthesis protein TsaB